MLGHSEGRETPLGTPALCVLCTSDEAAGKMSAFNHRIILQNHVYKQNFLFQSKNRSKCVAAKQICLTACPLKGHCAGEEMY